MRSFHRGRWLHSSIHLEARGFQQLFFLLSFRRRSLPCSPWHPLPHGLQAAMGKEDGAEQGEKGDVRLQDLAFEAGVLSRTRRISSNDLPPTKGAAALNSAGGAGSPPKNPAQR